MDNELAVIARNLDRLFSGKCKPRLETIYEHPAHYMIVRTCSCNHSDCVVRKPT